MNERGEWWVLTSGEAREGRWCATRILGRRGHYGLLTQSDFAYLLKVSRRTIIRAEQRGIDFFKSSIGRDAWEKVTGQSLRALPRPPRIRK